VSGCAPGDRQAQPAFVISVARSIRMATAAIDLIGEAMVACHSPPDKFDPDRVSSSSPMLWWITSGDSIGAREPGPTVRVHSIARGSLGIIKVEEILRQKLNREPSPEGLSQLTGLSWTSCSRCRTQHQRVRLDAPIDPKATVRSSNVSSLDNEMPDTGGESDERSSPTRSSRRCPRCRRARKVLRLYFGLEAGASTRSRRSAACWASPRAGAPVARCALSACAKVTWGAPSGASPRRVDPAGYDSGRPKVAPFVVHGTDRAGRPERSFPPDVASGLLRSDSGNDIVCHAYRFIPRAPCRRHRCEQNAFLGTAHSRRAAGARRPAQLSAPWVWRPFGGHWLPKSHVA